MEFLFDDEWIDHRTGVTRVLGKVHKEPVPILTPEMPWESGCFGGASLVFDGDKGLFKLWYRSSTVDATPTKADGRECGANRVFLCYAESRDGINWTRPALGILDFQGDRDNNIVKELPSDIDTPLFNVVIDPGDPDPARRYKAIGFDDSTTSSIRGAASGTRGVCVSYSPDGFQWDDPKLVMSTDDLTDCDCVLGQRDPTTGKWVAYFRPRTHPKRRFIGYSESTDFDHWSYPRMLLTPDGDDDRWTEFYGLTAACIGRWRIGCLWVMHNNPDFSPMTNELVYSRDGLDYRRAMPGTEFLPLGPDGSVDSRMITPIALIERENEFLLYYWGTNREHGSDRSEDGIGGVQMPPGRVDGEKRRSILGVARIPGRNFCGLRAEAEGIVETKWLCNYGGAGVVAYANVEKGGSIGAEMLDQYGRVIPGWSRDMCRADLDSGGLLHYSWGRGDLVGACDQVSENGGRIGHVVKLRFHLQRATLYAFQVGKDGETPPYE